MAYKLSAEEEKEAKEFATRFFGGTASALEQFIAEWWWVNHPEARDKFPFTRPEQHLPFWSNIIIGGISVAEALLGLGIEEDPMKLLERVDYKVKEQMKEFAKGLRKFGEGGILYSAPMLTKTTIVHNVPTPVAAPIGQVRTEQLLAGRVIKL